MVRLELRPGKGEYGALQVRIVNKGVNTKVSTGVKLRPKEWVAEAQTLRHPNDVRKQVSLGGLSYAVVNDKLQELRRALDAIDARGELTAAVARQCIGEILKEGVCEARYVPGGFVEFVDEYVEGLKSGRILKVKTKERFEKCYWQQYERAGKYLRRYEEWAGVKIGWGGLTENFFGRFCQYLKVTVGLRQNTVWEYSDKVRAMVKAAMKKKLVTCDVDLEEWSTTTCSPDAVYLSSEKLQQLYETDLQDEAVVERLIEAAREEDKAFVRKELKTECKRRMYENVRITLLKLCLSGQRFSDLAKIDKENVVTLKDGREYVRLRQKKTKKLVYIPVSDRLTNVLESRMEKKSQGQVGKQIKRLGRILGWCEVPNIQEEIGGMIVPTTRKFYEHMSGHTGRRTFATLAYQRGVSLASIMAVTGHKSEAMLRRYLKLDEEETAMMASAELFSISVAASAKVDAG